MGTNQMPLDGAGCPSAATKMFLSWGASGATAEKRSHRGRPGVHRTALNCFQRQCEGDTQQYYKASVVTWGPASVGGEGRLQPRYWLIVPGAPTWLSRVAPVVLADCASDRRGQPEFIRNCLMALSGGDSRWGVRQVSKARFLVVGNNAAVAEDTAEGGFQVANGTILHVQRWFLGERDAPMPQGLAVRLTLQGIPLGLCDKLGISTIVNRFATVEVGSLCFIAEGALTMLQPTAQLSRHSAVPPVCQTSKGMPSSSRLGLRQN